MCICTGECPGFEKLMPNLWKLINKVRLELPVDFAVVHPQLCTEDGDRFLRDILQPDSIYIIGACAPIMQRKLFRDSFEAKGVSLDNLISLDLRNITADEAFVKIKEAVESLEVSK